MCMYMFEAAYVSESIHSMLGTVAEELCLTVYFACICDLK